MSRPTRKNLRPSQVTGKLLKFTGDSGSGGNPGLVPPPSAGDAAAGKYLKADGTWSVPPDTDTNTIAAAVNQTEQEAGTENTKFVTPLVQQYHPSAAKAWGRVTVSAGVPSLSVSYNVSGITDSATGLLTVNLTTAFSSSSYVVIATPEAGGSASNMGVKVTIVDADTFTLRIEINDGTDVDPTGYHFVCYGDQ